MARMIGLSGMDVTMSPAKKAAKTRSLLAVAAMILAVSASLGAQSASTDVNGPNDTGFPPNAVMQGSDFDNVRINNGNLHIEIPVTAVAGRGETIVYRYVYDNKGWMFRTDPNVPPPQGPVGEIIPNVTQQFRYLGGPTYRVTYTGSFQIQCGVTPGGTIPIFYANFSGYTLIEADGTRHPFPGSYPLSTQGCQTTKPGTALYAGDGSGWILHIGFTSGDLWPVNAISKDGTVVSFIQDGSGQEANAVDRNGNIISGTTDTLGRAIPSPNGSYYDSNGTLQTFAVTTVSVPVLTALCPFYGLGSMKCQEDKGSLTQPSVITLPNGLTYQFTYAQSEYGEPTSVILPTGAQISWTWGNLDSGGRKVTSRTVTVGGQSFTWTYNYGFPGTGGTWINSVIDPLGNETDYTCKYLFIGSQGSGVGGDPGCTPIRVQYFQGSAASGTLIKTVDTTYLTTGAILPTAVNITWNQSNLVSRTETDWDSFQIAASTFRKGNPIEVREFGYGNGTPGALVRRTHYDYLYLDNAAYQNLNLAAFPTTVTTYDGSGNMVAQTVTGYDETALTATSGAPSHDYTNFGAGNNLRANATSISRWRNTDGGFIKTTRAYDDLGNLRSTTDANGNTTSLSYNDNWANTSCVPAGVNTQGYVTQITNPLGQNTQTAYYPCTGLAQSRQDQNDINAGRSGTTFTYDLLNRTLAINHADGGQASYNYNGDVPPFKVTKTVLATPDPSLVTSTTFDGLGRISQTSVDSAPGGPDVVDITYDALGRKLTRSNPHTATAAPTDGITTYHYDALSRLTQTTAQDGGIATMDFSQFPTITTTDVAGNQRRSTSDVLGRMIEVDEPGNSFAGTAAGGSITVGGNLQSAQVMVQAGVPGSGSVTIQGVDRSVKQLCGSKPNVHFCTFFDQGTVTITVNGFSKNVFYNSASTDATIAWALSCAFHNDSNSPVDAACPSSPGSSPTVSLTARVGGANTNYSLSCSDASNAGFSPPSFPPSCGSALTGGQDPVFTTVFDAGTVQMSLDGYTATANYGNGAGQDNSAAAVASDLAGKIQAQLPASNAPFNISPSGATISINWNSVGAAGNITVSTTSTTTQTNNFSAPSFATCSIVSNPQSCNAALTGGADPYPSGVAHPFVTLYAYDTLGDLTCVEQHGDAPSGTGCSAPSSSDATSPWRVRRFAYDSLSRLLSAANPESGTINYSYDAIGNTLQKTTPAANQTVSYCYDALNRVTGKAYAAETCTNGQLPPGTAVISYNYDSGANGIGHLTSFTDQAGSAAYTYDPLGRILTEQRTLSGISKSMSYSYNLDGAFKTLTYPSGAVVTYSMDGAEHQVSAVDAGNGINYVTSATYGPDGSIIGFVSGNSSSFAGISNSFSYNTRLQPVTMSAASPTATVFSITYDFHMAAGDNGNVWGIINNKDASRSQSFSYDALNRLTTAQNSGTDCTQTTPSGHIKFWGNTYAYDAWGNLLQKTVNKCSSENLTVAALVNNQLAGYGYDAAGNMTSDPTDGVTATYDVENRIATAVKNGITTTYTYDDDGNRVKKTNGTTGRLYWYMTPGIVGESDLAGNLQSEYIFLNGTRVARKDLAGNAVSYYFSDHLKTAAVITDSAGNITSESDFLPWGGELGFIANDSNHYKFTGKERDTETSLDYFGARYYSSLLGRFLSADPSRKSIDPGNPQSWNRYSYGLNSPLVYVDQNGRWPTRIHEEIIDAAFQGNLTAHEIAKIKEVSKYQDRPEGQLAKNAHWHGQCAPSEAIGACKAAIKQHIDENLAKAKSIGDEKGLSDDALTYFATAGHTLMDIGSPSHTLPDGTPTPWGLTPDMAVEDFTHVLGEEDEAQSWYGIGRSISLLVHKFYGVFPGEARERFGTDAEAVIERAVDRIVNNYYRDAPHDPWWDIRRDAARQCALGNRAACDN